MYHRIAVEEAFVTSDIVAEWRKLLATGKVEPGFKLMGESVLADRPETRVVHERLLDLGAGRIAHMDATGISLQVVSLTAPGVQVSDAATGTSLAASANDELAAAVGAHESRFVGLAAVAPQDPEAAAKEVSRAAGKLGLKGVIINSHTHGEYLDAPKFGPLLQACAECSMPIYLHPREPGPGHIVPYSDYGLYFAGWGFAAEAGLHAMRLIMSGTLERYPGLKIILGHMGEGIPYWLQRIDNRYQMQVKIRAIQELPRLPSEYFLRHFVITTSGVTHHGVLRLCQEVVGTERILFAADYPYESVEEAVEYLDTAPLTEGARIAIYRGNAEQVFRLRGRP